MACAQKFHFFYAAEIAAAKTLLFFAGIGVDYFFDYKSSKHIDSHHDQVRCTLVI